MEQPNYYAIIPAKIRYDKNLCANAKLLYGEITALTDKTGVCWATNNYFSNLYNVSQSTIISWINQLIKNNHIKREIVYKYNSKEIESRYLSIIDTPLCEKLDHPPIKNKTTPPIKNKIDNNINNNNTSNIKETNINVRKENLKKMQIPTFEEIKEYTIERNRTDLAKDFYDYFKASEKNGYWYDSRGDVVKNWKQKFITWQTRNKNNRGNENVKKRDGSKYAQFCGGK